MLDVTDTLGKQEHPKDLEMHCFGKGAVDKHPFCIGGEQQAGVYTTLSLPFWEGDMYIDLTKNTLHFWLPGLNHRSCWEHTVDFDLGHFYLRLFGTQVQGNNSEKSGDLQIFH